jgi:hypothetical protein
MHLGDNGAGRFWCGFCKDIVRQEARSDCNPREMRMQHVGDHYDKEDSDYVSLQALHASDG